MNKNYSEIIIVEDNFDDVNLIKRVIKNINLPIEIKHLKDGFDAFNFLFTNELSKNIKLILLDLKMPKINGFELLEKIKTFHLTKNIPVIIFTSSDQEKDINTCYHLGANSYIVKPILFEDFMKTFSQIIYYWIDFNEKYVHP
ncbi:MAG: response regulator [Cyanobacteriota bacterium]